MKLDVLGALFLVAATSDFAAGSVRLAIVPKMVENGSSVTMTCTGDVPFKTCSFNNPASDLWDQVIGNNVTKECSTDSIAHNNTHHGNWKCAHTIYGQPTQNSEPVELVVALLPTKPQLYLNSDSVEDGSTTSPIRENDENVTMKCESLNGRPRAEIVWYIEYGDKKEKIDANSEFHCNVTGGEKPIDDTVTGNAISSLNDCNFGSKSNRAKLLCVANHPFFREDNASRIVLDVHFEPVNYRLKDKPNDAGDNRYMDPESNEFYHVPINSRVVLNVLIQANPMLDRVVWESRLFDGVSLRADSDTGMSQGRFSANKITKAMEEQQPNLGIDRDDVYLASLTIERTQDGDVHADFTLTPVNELCASDCNAITFKIVAGEKKNPGTGLSGGAIAGIVLAVLAVVLIIAIVIIARRNEKLCFRGASQKTEGSETESSGGGAQDEKGKKPSGFRSRLVDFLKPQKSKRRDEEENREELQVLDKPAKEDQPEKEEGVVYAQLDLKKGQAEVHKKEATTEYSEIVGTTCKK